jgi:acyl carrier protein
LLAWFRRLYIDSEDADVIETLSAETRFVEDISVDSLDYIEFLVEAEQTFGVTIPDRNAERLLTVGDFLRYIRDCLRNGDAKPISADTEKLWDRDLDR